MNKAKLISVRDLQHNLSNYLDLAKAIPLMITKHGKSQVVMLDPKQYTITKKKNQNQESKDLMASPFIGMLQHDEQKQKISSLKQSQQLRQKAWYGK